MEISESKLKEMLIDFERLCNTTRGAPKDLINNFLSEHKQNYIEQDKEVECHECSGKGSLKYAKGVAVCYNCNGTGKVK